MIKVEVRLNNIDNIKEFCNYASQMSYDIDLISGRYIIDAKSIMGIFSIDLSKSITVNIHAEKEEAQKFLDLIKEFVVE